MSLSESCLYDKVLIMYSLLLIIFLAPVDLRSLYQPPDGDIPSSIRHPAPEPLPNIQALRPVTSEIETQTSMLILPNSNQPIRDRNEENISVSNSECLKDPSPTSTKHSLYLNHRLNLHVICIIRNMLICI